jgi:predicted anti-sigma-YlaC factor YlaD
MTHHSCDEIERTIWTDGPEAAPREHLQSCDSCREESRRAGDLQAALTGLRLRYEVPPAGLEDEIVASLGRKPSLGRAREIIQHPKFWRGAAVAGAAVGSAAVGLIVARRRSAARTEDELVA